jgi:LacI family transcriptional regulator
MTLTRRKKVTIRDVAKAAGVSTATVSRSLNGTGNVPAATQETINSVVAKLGYSHAQGSNGRKQEAGNTIGVLIPDLLNPFFASMLDGISEQAMRHGVGVKLVSSRNDPARDAPLIEQFIADGVGGIIVTPAGNDAPYVRLAERQGIPCLFADRTAESSKHWVISDDVEGSYLATKYLLGLNHRDILFVGGNRQLSTEVNRVAGYKQALGEFGVHVRDDMIREIGFDPESAYHEVAAIPNGGRSFTAIVAGDDLIAIGAKKALEDRGLGIPRDVSIIGYGDMYFSSFMALSTVSSPSREIGKNSFLLLLDLLHKRVERSQQLKLRPSLILRSSCSVYEA